MFYTNRRSPVKIIPMMAIAEINARHGTSFSPLCRYEGGEAGAVRLVDEAGRHFVLKFQPTGLAPATTDALRPLGYPVPRYVLEGPGYHVQEELRGRPAGDWGVAGPEVMARLVELNELQADRAVDDDASWPETIVESVTAGFSEFCVVETLEGHSDASRELLRLCRRAVERHSPGLAPSRDIAHMDFTLANVLVEDGGVTGVIDWGGTRTGDRLFDLSTLLYYARGEAPDLERYVVGRIGHEGLAVYVAHLAVRQSDWSLRHHGLDAGNGAVDYALSFAPGFP
jgi:aminoglycoside phosphotransferase (APT) family kinase protein